MKKTLAILATVATVGALTITAPAQARGIGPGIAFGLAAGAIAAGAAGAYGYYGPGYGYPAYYGQPTTDPVMPITAGRIGVTATGTGTTGKNQKSPELASGLFLDAS
jgi:hypothetical protein